MTTHPTELLAGHVLGNLEPREQAAVEAHLAQCPACRAEVARQRDALYGLAQALPAADPPPGTWERIEARRAPGAGPATPSVGRPPWWGLGLAAGVALLLAGGVASGWLFSPARTAQTDVQRWTAQGAAQRPLISRSGAAVGTLLVRPDGQALLVLGRPAPGGQVYQAWGRRASGPRAGVPVSLGLTAGATLRVTWTGYDSVGVSLEPAGGSPAPTRPLGRADVRG
ncbi:anti-sigma factor domain-containing protein [Deinococcus gobiensis]|uniref:anti-sigma factor n=1 Tax=Deinococcus gobiensis TaxID=502394 RepID=UPI000A05A865|nr:anti-sigma factor [Deinococcus gobiensis]